MLRKGFMAFMEDIACRRVLDDLVVLIVFTIDDPAETSPSACVSVQVVTLNLLDKWFPSVCMSALQA
jgi:hypothetical protein